MMEPLHSPITVLLGFRLHMYFVAEYDFPFENVGLQKRESVYVCNFNTKSHQTPYFPREAIKERA